MSLINVISVPTAHGVKTIEIHNADITNLNWKCDILVLSAYHNKYKPAPNTVINALESNTGLILSELANKPKIDLRETFNCWITDLIEGHNFNYIICLEGIKTAIENDGNSESAIANLFGFISILHYKKIQTSSIAMPVLGSGYQGNSIELILNDLIETAIKTLNFNANLQTIYFVEIDAEKAQLIDKTINLILKRDNQKLETVSQDPLSKELLEQALSKLIQITDNVKTYKHNKTIINLIDKISTGNIRFFELGVLSRKLMELLIPEISLLKSDKYIPLYEHLNELKTKNIADWMITYLHTLRVFGNFVAHKEETRDIPENMDKTDIIVFCHALNRFLDLYISFNSIYEKNRKIEL